VSVPLGVTTAGPASVAVQAHLPALVTDRVASRIAAKDPSLWGPAAEDEAGRRLGWVDLPQSSRELVEPIRRLRDELVAGGMQRVVLCGMGGSSLAPEVITAAAGVDLTVLDGTDPDQVRRVLSDRLEFTVVVVSSKSGSTVETDSQRRAFEFAFDDLGIDPATRIVVVTDPGSPLEQAAREAGYRAVFTADPEVGGRYSALSAFGLVPSGLAGADIGALLDQAAEVSGTLATDSEDNPALRLGAALGGTGPREREVPPPLRDKVVIVDDGSGLPGFGDWAEQLVAESTGKDGTGLLPVVVRTPDAPEVRDPADDVLVVRLVPDATAAADEDGAHVRVSGTLGAQMLLWEYATVVAGRLLGINPFDQPDVESAKTAARGMLDARPDPGLPALVDGVVEVRGSDGLLDGVRDLEGAVDALLGALDRQRGYVAVMAYLDREAHADLAGVRDDLAERAGRPVTFGWGPRFLHSTGQYHKGGPPNGVYLQVTAAPTEDLVVPGRPFTFGELVAAQAAGDASVLADHGRPVLRLHLKNRAVGLPRLQEALGRAGVSAP
jgi:glucose-6-phosphate isomerase